MIQEVQIILTMSVDAEKSKKDIKAFFLDMEQTYTRTVSSRNRWEFPKIDIVEIKEEAEIYNTNEIETISQWLPYPENKPEQFSWVLVTIKSPTDKWVEMAGFDGENFQLPGRGNTNFVTHWMPIPNPA